MHTKVLVPKLRMAKWLVLLSFMTLMLFAVSPVQAADPATIIEAGDTVFIGEQGLNVTLALNGATSIARWAPGADRTVDQPDHIVPVPLVDQGSFNIGTANFRGFEGPYYQWTGTPPAGNFTIQVSEPSLAIVLHDTQGVVSSGSSRYLGTRINFEIQTNLNTLVTQRGVSTGFINMYARSPNGITYTTLFTSDTVQRSLVDLIVGTNPYYWSSSQSDYWKTASKDVSQQTLRYPAGLYSIWAESFVNQMNIISANQQLNLITETLTITSPSSVTRSNQFTVNVTGRPNTTYTLFIMGDPCNKMSGGDCDQPPMILDGQKGVEFDPKSVEQHLTYPIGNQLVYPVLCKEDATILDVVPSSPYNGTRYYANVTTDATGVISVGFSTSPETAPRTYTIHVQGMGLDEQPKYADAFTAITMGVVTLNLPSTAILGETVPISGSNTDSFTTYLYLTGPCQPVCGANLTTPGTPVINGVGSSFTWINVTNYDRTWIYNAMKNGWVTSELKIQPGEYTIYATSKPVDACHLPGCVAYTSRVISLLEPTLEATITPEILVRDCCSGQCVIINGNSTGNAAHEIEYWIFGEQKIGDKHYYHGFIEDCCGDFEINLCDILPISSIPTGKYYVVLQHPMYNHVFDVMIEGDKNGTAAYQPPASTIIGEQNKLYVISSAPIRWSKMFPIEGADAKREIDAFNALINALNDPGIDDIYLTLNFTVKDAYAPTAAFTGSPTSGSAPLGVQFLDQSEGNPTSWAWEFGDGTTSTEQYPNHIYAQEGVFSVKLTASKVVSGTTYSDHITKVNYITVGAVPLQAAFTGSPRSGQTPVNVQFTDQSTGLPTSWFWDFGDGQYSSVQNPSHTYATPGSFAVTLTASKLGVSNSLTVPNYIVVSGVPTTTPTPTPTPVPYDRITLNPGWNFVSTPKVLASGYNTGSIFSEVNMGGRSAWIWDGSRNPPQWVPIISTTPIQPLWGMWIYSVSNTVVNLHFDPSSYITPPSRSLPAGWSSIGFTGSTQTTARNTYLSVQPNWTTSMGFNAVSQQYEQTIFNGDPTEFTTLFPTKGYWLYMRSPGNLAAIGV